MKRVLRTLSIFLILIPVMFFVACGKSKDDNSQKGYEVSLENAYAVAQDKGYVGTYEEFIQAIKGEKGEDGKSILDVEKHTSIGVEDTYKITFSDGTFSYFTITNGKDGNGISAINKGSSSVVEGRNQTKYTILYTNGSSFDFFVTDGKDGEDGKGIKTIVKTAEDGLVDTYTILYTDNSKTIISVTNGKDGEDGTDGRGIKTIAKTETDGLVDTYTITYTDNTSTFFYVTNGKDGVDGEDGADGLGITNIATTRNEEDNSTTVTITYDEDEKTETFILYDGKDGVDGEDGKGIKAIAKTATEGFVDTYTITYTDNTESTFTVTNGIGVKHATVNEDGNLIIQLTDDRVIDAGNVRVVNGVKSIEKTSTNGLEVVYTITYDNGDTTTFTIKNGKDGEDGRGIKEIQKDSVGLTDTYTIMYTDDTTYTFTVTNGQNGLSAYEIYKVYFPEYTKSEYDWILDLVNGELATKQEETLTVAFDSNGGSAVESQTGIKYAGKAIKPTNPTKEGYEFEGWFYQDEKWSFVGYSVTENITLSAKWTPIEYTVSFDSNGHGNFEDTSITFEDDLILPEVTVPNYNCEWQIAGETITNGKWNISQDVTIELLLTPVEYTITYVLNDGTNHESNPSRYTVESENITLLDATKKNYHFIGWWANDSFTGDQVDTIETGSSGNLTLYACFERNHFEVEIDTDGGSVENYTLSIYGGEEYTLPLVSKENYAFNEWIGYTNEEKTEYVSLPRTGNWDYDNILYVKATYHAIYETEGSTITGTTRYFEIEDLVIPTQIDGVEITEIGDGAFFENTQLKSITIPNTITTIGSNAFYGCSNVTELTIGEGVSCIKNSAFSSLKSLETLNYNAVSGTDFYKMYAIGDKPAMFKHLGKDSEGVTVNFGANVESLPSWLFYAPDATYAISPNITQINYAENCKLEKIGDGTFLGLTSLKSITIPKSVKQIGYRAFSDLWGIEEIIFNSEMLIWNEPEDGVNDYQDAIGAFVGVGQNTSGTKFVIGADVKELQQFPYMFLFGDDDYTGITNIKTLDFLQNSNISRIETSVFAWLKELENLFLSATITKIDEGSFCNNEPGVECKEGHVKNIYYAGLPGQLTIGADEYLNQCLLESNVYYYAEPNGEFDNAVYDYWHYGENGEIEIFSFEKYSITYNLDGGILSAGHRKFYTSVDNDHTLETPKKPGIEFVGWFDSADFENANLVTEIEKGSTGNVEVFAKWGELIEYSYSIEVQTLDRTGELDLVNVGGVVESYSVQNVNEEEYAESNRFNADYCNLIMRLIPKNRNYRLAGVYVNGVIVEESFNREYSTFNLFDYVVVDGVAHDAEIVVLFVPMISIKYMGVYERYNPENPGSYMECCLEIPYNGEIVNVSCENKDFTIDGAGNWFNFNISDNRPLDEEFLWFPYTFTVPFGTKLTFNKGTTEARYYFNWDEQEFNNSWSQLLAVEKELSFVAACYYGEDSIAIIEVKDMGDLQPIVESQSKAHFVEEDKQTVIVSSYEPLITYVPEAISEDGVLYYNADRYVFKGWWMHANGECKLLVSADYKPSGSTVEIFWWKGLFAVFVRENLS